MQRIAPLPLRGCSPPEPDSLVSARAHTGARVPSHFWPRSATAVLCSLPCPPQRRAPAPPGHAAQHRHEAMGANRGTPATVATEQRAVRSHQVQVQVAHHAMASAFSAVNGKFGAVGIEPVGSVKLEFAALRFKSDPLGPALLSSWTKRSPFAPSMPGSGASVTLRPSGPLVVAAATGNPHPHRCRFPWHHPETPSVQRKFRCYRPSTGASATPVWVPRRTTPSGVSAATMRPPSRPPSGPRSITQSASATTSRSCSITTTLWPP